MRLRGVRPGSGGEMQRVQSLRLNAVLSCDGGSVSLTNGTETRLILAE